MNTDEHKSDDIKKHISLINDFMQQLGKSDLQSQIEFVDFLNKNVILSPMFISIINSLKELQSFKRKQYEKK